MKRTRNILLRIVFMVLVGLSGKNTGAVSQNLRTFTVPDLKDLKAETMVQDVEELKGARKRWLEHTVVRIC